MKEVSHGDLGMVARVASRFANKTVKVKNRETGKVLYKTPKEFRENRDKYQELPQEYDREPKGRPRKAPEPGDIYLPAPEKLPRPKKFPKPKKRPKPIQLVPLPKIPEPPRPAPSDKPKSLRWKRE